MDNTDNKRKILITNDDGIKSDGIRRLAECALEFGEVWVVAPENQRSAMSHSISLREPIEVWEEAFPVPGVHAFACSGTPADCVRVGVRNIVPNRPDLVFSGINFGYNLATDIQYSATAGAAFEGAFQNVRSIAFSEGMGGTHFTTDKYLREVMEELIDRDPGMYRIWNVNFPECTADECRGILRNRVAGTEAFYDDDYAETRLENGKISFKVIGTKSETASEGSDLRAVLDKYVSIGVLANIGAPM